METDDATLRALQRENLDLHARIAELERTAAKYDALCSVTPDIMLVIDEDGGYVEIAPTRGFPPELRARRLGTTIRSSFPAELAEEMIGHIRRALATREPVRFEYPVPQAPEKNLRHTAVLAPLSATSVLWFSQDVTAARELERAERSLRIFAAIVESSPDGVAMIGPDGAFVYMNAAYRGLLGAAPATNATIHDVHTDARAVVADAMRAALAAGTWQGRLTLRGAEGSSLPCQVSIVRLDGDDEDARRLAVIARDLTPFVEAERQRVALQERIIAAQRSALRELSTPLLPLAPGVLAMPLIGALDSARAQEVMETVLEGVVRQRAHTAILDITGVRTLDARAADALLAVARAVRLLGTRVIFTGIGPDIAQTLVGLAPDLRGISVRGTLQDGIAEALHGAAQRR